jgi:hypothetical protein
MTVEEAMPLENAFVMKRMTKTATFVLGICFDSAFMVGGGLRGICFVLRLFSDHAACLSRNLPIVEKRARKLLQELPHLLQQQGR